jgi:hypothetical protein
MGARAQVAPNVTVNRPVLAITARTHRIKDPVRLIRGRQTPTPAGQRGRVKTFMI